MIIMSAENGSSPSLQEKKIIRQIEYYFGDFNLPRDKFMQEKLKEDDGWVKMETMTNFKRLASLTTDHKVIIEALRKGKNSLMEISEDETKIRRSPSNPIPDSIKTVYDKYEDRTVFAKGFGTDATFDEIQDFFDKVGPTVNIVMRRSPHGKGFKSSVYVSFKEKDDCDKFLTSDDFAKYKDNELIRKMRTDYMKDKVESRKEAKAKVADSRADADAKRQEMQKARLRARMTLGALLELSGIPKGVAENVIITRIKEMMRESSTPDVAYVETNKLKDGIVVVRFKEENSAAQALSKLQAKENGLKFTAGKSANKDEEKMDEKDDKKDKEETNAEGDNAEKKETSDEETDAGKAEEQPEATEIQDLVGRVLTGDDEEAAWQHLLDERQQRASKRRGGFRRDGEPSRKKGKFSKS